MHARARLLRCFGLWMSRYYSLRPLCSLLYFVKYGKSAIFYSIPPKRICQPLSGVFDGRKFGTYPVTTSSLRTLRKKFIRCVKAKLIR